MKVDAVAICREQLPAAQRYRQGDLRDMPTLKPGTAQLVGARLAVAAVAVSAGVEAP
jgi:hypothetical protein